MSSSTRRPPRTSSSGRGGRGGGRGGRGNSRRGGRNARSSSPQESSSFSDEDVLIAFMPFMRNGDEEAAVIHERFGNDQRAFVGEVRLFLEKKKNEPEAAASPPSQAPVESAAAPASPQARSTATTPILTPQPGKTPFPTPISSTIPQKVLPISMGDLTDRMDRLVNHDNEDAVFSNPAPPPGMDPFIQQRSPPPGMPAIPNNQNSLQAPAGNSTRTPPPPFTPASPSAAKQPPIGSSPSNYMQPIGRKAPASPAAPTIRQPFGSMATSSPSAQSPMHPIGRKAPPPPVAVPSARDNPFLAPPSPSPHAMPPLSSPSPSYNMTPPPGGPPTASPQQVTLPHFGNSLESPQRMSSPPGVPSLLPLQHNMTSGVPPVSAPHVTSPLRVPPVSAPHMTSAPPPGVPPVLATHMASPPSGAPQRSTNDLSSPSPIVPTPHNMTSPPSGEPPEMAPHLSSTPPAALSSTPPTGPSGNWVPCPPGKNNDAIETTPTDLTPTTTPQDTPKASPPKKEYQPKRLWTRLEEQPGRLLANNVPASTQKTFRLRPRQELTAKWMLPLSYLRQRHAGKEVSLRQALDGLAVGLYRQGCTENGSNASIISKEILSPPEESRKDYPIEVDQRSDTVWGTVPFYSPRTPGHVVLRLYWQDQPLHTLATGPTLYVCVSNSNDVEPTLRFILSNFKSKSKNNNTSLSSLHSLTAVLDTFNPPREPRGNNNARWHSAGRAAWGCICESKKVLEACAAEYLKQKDKLVKLEKEVNELQEEVDADNEIQKNLEQMLLSEVGSEGPSETEEKFREKKNQLMGGRASNERRWKDAQLAFASILKAIVTNPSSSLLFKRDLLSEIRLEYELWCPLCEAFAPSPFCASDESSSSMVDTLCVNRNLLPRPITGEHFRMCTESRTKMQMDTLGFQPNPKQLEDVLIPTRNTNRKSPNHKKPGMDPTAVGAFNALSSAMCQLYQDVYLTSDLIHQERELVRSRTENLVAQCTSFPPGTKVAVFGSAANGFGSPTSDLDMCLQLPANAKLTNDDDKSGATAMAQLAELFEQAGLKNVDTARLTARIPVIKFNFPHAGSDGDDSLVDCDLSMQNPLACLNTSLLLTYSRINPMTTVLASIIKRWAKSRDINDPSRHTLSSYGYILMLLHFLTFHQSTGSGLVTTLARTEGENVQLEKPPLLPNLSWMDPNWPKSPAGTPYREMTTRPKNLIPHPSEPNFVVNAYFYRLSDQSALTNLQRRFPGQDSSVAVLLASFFRYYAFEFDYKKYVVSLHSTASRGLVEREVKAEIDCWKVYFQGLAIEDPFETFYDVAHVVKGSNFHRLRHELALAYTKIVDAASGRSCAWHKRDVHSMTGNDLLDWICEPVSDHE